MSESRNPLNTKCQSRFTKIFVVIQRPGCLKTSWLLIKMGHFSSVLSEFLTIADRPFSFRVEKKKKSKKNL